MGRACAGWRNVREFFNFAPFPMGVLYCRVERLIQPGERNVRQFFLFRCVSDECPVLPSEWNGRKHFYAGALCCFADFYYFCPIYDRQIDS